MKPRLIAFCGVMGSGKSTAIKCLKDIQHAPITLHKFAQTLYDIQEDIYWRISPVHTRPDDFVKDRKLLQWLGTEWGRETIDKDLWTKLWFRNVKTILEEYPNYFVVCDDLRFDNEAVLVKNLGGIIIKIDSDKANQRIDTNLSGHKSESGVNLSYIDYIIENNGSIDDLKTSLLSINEKESLW